MSFNYNPISRERIKNVSLCGFKDSDYKKYRKNIIEKSKKKTREKRKKDYEKYGAEIEKFIEGYNIIKNSFGIKEILESAKYEGPRTCGNCPKSKNDKYRDGDDKLVCWWNKPHGSRPRKVEADTKKSNCQGYYSKKVKIILPTESYEIDSRRYDNAKRQLDRNKRTKSLLMIAWAISGLDEKKDHFQPKWIKGILNEFDRHTFDLSLAKDAEKYEKEQRQYIKDLTGGEDLDRVIKYRCKDKHNPLFKIMDLLLDYKNKNHIFEITKAWNLESRNKVQ